jgi:hypothetical protein
LGLVKAREGEGAMTKPALRQLLEQLRRMPNPTPAEALAELRRLLANEVAKPPKH